MLTSVLFILNIFVCYLITLLLYNYYIVKKVNYGYTMFFDIK